MLIVLQRVMKAVLLLELCCMSIVFNLKPFQLLFCITVGFRE
jgi:hypothetical protein